MEDILEIKESEYITGDSSTRIIDPFDPFENPTENHCYNEDYSKIVPQITQQGCVIPIRPAKAEKKAIRRDYNIAGVGLVANFLFAQLIAYALTVIAMFLIMRENDMSFSDLSSTAGNFIRGHIYNSSISPAITLLTFLTVNLATFFLGIRFLGIKTGRFFSPKGLTILNVLKYILIGAFLQYGSGMIVNVVRELFSEADISGQSAYLINYSSLRSFAVSAFYTCIAAPLTEELFYRGFVMKAFSVTSQRFGIIASALFFALGHGNVAQFILTFIMGIFLGYIDIKHDSVLPSIFVHFSANLTGTAASAMSFFEVSVQSTLYIAFTVCLLMASAVGLVLLIIMLKKETFPKASIAQQYRSGLMSLTSIGTLAALLILSVNIIWNTMT